jgi:hypothetical protein
MFVQTLNTLQAKGYFVKFLEESFENRYIFECTMYFTDTAEDGTPTNPLCIDVSTSTIYDGKCIACNASLMEGGIPSRPKKRGSIECPLCLGWTEPWSISMRTYRGIFKIDWEEKRVDYLFPPAPDPPLSIPSIRSKELIEERKSALLSEIDVSTI